MLPRRQTCFRCRTDRLGCRDVADVVRVALLGWQLLLIAVIDLEHYWLPDRLTLPLLATGVVATVIIDPFGLLNSVVGAALGFGMLWLLAFAYRQVRGRQGLGSGDPILFAGIGAWVGWQNLPVVLLIACLVGLGSVMAKILVKRPLSSDGLIPFGPLLAIGTFAVWTWQL